ncbi:MAG: 2,5-diketo-D-gluconic acid reductase [Chthonomonas sp.]
MKTLFLNNGIEIPIIGYGVFQIADPDLCEQSVRIAIDLGYRLIDTAASYGNEEAVGHAIGQSGVSREKLFVTTKLWVQDASYGGALQAFDRSRGRLRLDTIDLYLIHQPYGDVHGAWRAMEELLGAGKVRAIGVSNFHPDRLMDLIVHHDVVPAVNQIEVHPFHQQREAQNFLQENHVQVQAWGPLAEGKNNLFHNETLVAVAQAHDKTTAQIVLRWLVQRNVVAIPKSVRRERMAENLDVFEFELTDGDMDAIASLDTGHSLFFDHRDPAVVKWLGERRLAPSH